MILCVKYLFLKNTHTNKYERLNYFDETTAKIGLVGDYILSMTNLNRTAFGMYIIIVIVLLLCISFVLFVLFRKKYWFW
ncbi:MAG: hypothetical protein FWH52_01400 [Synergistaceae bacterium]|nr:hypothetical protein [Synergistaceae bacterium]